MTAEPRRRRLLAVTASLTALVVTISSVGAWMLFGGIEAAQAGTLSHLREAGSAGGWRTIDAQPLDISGNAADPGGAELEGFSNFSGVEGEPESWVVQVTAEAASDAATVFLTPEARSADDVEADDADDLDTDVPEADAAEGEIGEVEPAAPLLRVEAGTTASVTTLVRAPAGAAPRLVSDADVIVTAEAVAYLVEAGEEGPEPGGSVATAPFRLADTGEDLGFSLEQAAAGVSLSPLGLGGVPVDGVAGVWVQATSAGSGAEITLTSAAESEAAEGGEATGAGQGLYPVRLDENGEFHVRVNESADGLALNVVGWIADAKDDTRQGVIDSGLQLGGPLGAEAIEVEGGASLTAPDTAPQGAMSLFGVSFDAGTGASTRLGQADGGAGSLGASPTNAAVGGATSAIVVAESEAQILEQHPDAVSANWLGFFADREGDGTAAPEITVDSPAEGDRVELVETGGFVTFSGTARAEAGVESVHLKKDRRYIGSAQLRHTADGVEWSLRTSAPSGAHELTAVVTDLAGEEAERTVEFAVGELAPDDVVIDPNTVVVGDDLMRNLAEVTADALVFEGDTFVKPDDIVNMPVSELTPDGALRRVSSVQRVGGQQVLRTTSATLTDMIYNADVNHRDVPVGPSAGPSTLSIPASSKYAYELEQEGREGGAGGAGPVRGASQTRLPATTETRPALETEVAGVDTTLTVTIEGESDFDGKTKPPAAGWEYEMNARALGVSAETTLAGDLQVESAAPINDAVDTGESGGDDGAKKGNSGLEQHAEFSGEFKRAETLQYYLNFEVKIAKKPLWRLHEVELEEAEISVVERASVETSVKMSGGYSADFSFARKQTGGEGDGRVKLFDYKAMVGWVPVWLTGYFLPEVSVSFEVTADYQYVERYSSVRKSGFRYERGDIRAVNEEEHPVEGGNPSTNFSAELAVDAELTLSGTILLKAYELVGAGVGLEAVLTLDFDATAAGGSDERSTFEYEGSLEGVLNGVVEARLEIFDKTLLQKEARLKFAGFRWGFGSTSSGDSETEGGSEEEDLLDPGAPSDGERPLAIVIDVSGSMSGNRLDNAKDSLLQLVDAQPPGAETGVWTYPEAGGDGCSAGSFAVEMKAHNGKGELKQTIQGLDATGGTPTGEALRAVADDLKSKGYDGANILLVSDGESNCDIPPCEVAEQIVAEGFDISAPTIAIGAGASEELACISGATNSPSIVVDEDVLDQQANDAAEPSETADSADEGEADPSSGGEDELLELIEELTMPTLEATLTVPSTLQRGDAQRVEVRLENTSVRDVTGAEFSLVSAGGDSATVNPATSIVGNIPVGGTVTRTVEVVPDDRARSVDLQLLAWGTNAPLATAEAAFTIHEAGAAELEPEPGGVLTETGDGERHLLVLGDGAVTVADETSETVESEFVSSCTHGPAVAAEAVFAADRLTIAACLEYDGIASLEQQLGSAPDKSTVSNVLMSAGGAEVGLADVVSTCLETGCTTATADVQNAIRVSQELDLEEHLRVVWQEVNGSGGSARTGAEAAPIYVSPYPYLFPEDRGLRCSTGIGPEEALALNTVVDYLNTGIEASVEEARAQGVEVYFMGGAEQALQSANSLCSEEPGVLVPEGPAGGVEAGSGEFQPILFTAAGDSRMTHAVGSWSENRDRELPARAFQEPDPIGGGANTLGVLTSPRITLSVDAPAASYGADIPAERTGLERVADRVVKPGQKMRVEGDGYRPGSQVYVTFTDDRAAVIGKGRVDADGGVELETRVPEQASTGAASIEVLGVNERGESFRTTSDVAVGAHPPGWVFVAGALTVGLLLAAALLSWLPGTTSRVRSPRSSG